MEWTFEVAGTPVPKERPRAGRAGALTAAQKRERAAAKKAGHAWTDPRAVVFRTPERTTSYERAVAAAAQHAGVMVRDNPCRICVRVWLPPGSTMDLDNVLKSICDGLMLAGKAALTDDRATIVQQVEAIYAGADAVRPRALITVARLTEADRERLQAAAAMDAAAL
jgi:Holliday junction resolvase RusA-like endonuclease